MDYTIPLDAFARPKASIDFITISLPSSLDTAAHCHEFHENIEGRIELPKGRNKDWITIHDPHTSDLQWLMDNHPEARILSFEVAIDFTLQDDSHDPERLSELHGWLKTRLFPQRHASMAMVGKRKYYDARIGQVVPDTLKTKSGNETVYWTNPNAYEQVRLYIKTLDNQKPTDCHSVRLEPTLFRGGCQNAGLYRVAELPKFADQLRRYLSRFVFVAAGIKPKIKRTRSNAPQKAARATHEATKESNRVARAWQRYGAAWAATNEYDTMPDTKTNRLIGAALKGLRDDLLTLKLTRKVAKHPDHEVLAKPVNTDNHGPSAPLCIEGQLSFSQSEQRIDIEQITQQDRTVERSNCKGQPIKPRSRMEEGNIVCTLTK